MASVRSARILWLVSACALLASCSIYQSARAWCGETTEFARLYQPMRIMNDCARELGLTYRGGGGGGAQGGSLIQWSHGGRYLGDEANRTALMQKIEARVDETLEAEGLTVTGTGRWSTLPGFSREYESGSQRGSLHFYSAATAAGAIEVRYVHEERPR